MVKLRLVRLTNLVTGYGFLLVLDTESLKGTIWAQGIGFRITIRGFFGFQFPLGLVVPEHW